ncbi:hypothetical protein BQ8482_360087 [Mesorhizobium delmotii]|uniref:Uncharacterized protein n=1 Tax=Mesorhizobium delmotii TaxID=1631247 RepID=A0A2P9ARB1_9HYPH|nr:hypothetical protein BQ8482_360087 [Mesorhizobium delmotii]
MASGAHLLAVLWERAWAVGDGDTHVASTEALSAAMRICADLDFIPSVSISRIGVLLNPLWFKPLQGHGSP